MKYDAFRKLFETYPLISWPLIKMLTPGDQQMKVQLCRWKKDGKLVRLNKNYFILNDADRKINPSKLHLACELYKPSYISLEYALSFHELIPERVADLTCISTKKTKTFINSFGTFGYRHIKTECFTGFTTEKDEEGLHYYIADAEKAIVDFLYLNLDKINTKENPLDPHGFLMESYRLQNLEILDKKKLLKYAAFFKCGKLSVTLKGLIND